MSDSTPTINGTDTKPTNASKRSIIRVSSICEFDGDNFKPRLFIRIPTQVSEEILRKGEEIRDKIADQFEARDQGLQDKIVEGRQTEKFDEVIGSEMTVDDFENFATWATEKEDSELKTESRKRLSMFFQDMVLDIVDEVEDGENGIQEMFRFVYVNEDDPVAEQMRKDTEI